MLQRQCPVAAVDDTAAVPVRGVQRVAV